MNFETLRVGNVVKYVGPLNEYKDYFARILSMETLNDDNSFELEILDSKTGGRPVVRAYADDIHEIYLKPDFLLKNEFRFDNNKLYTNSDISLLKIDFAVAGVNIYGQTEGIALEDKGFGVLLDKIDDYTTKEGILSKVQLLNSVHSLQNYYELALEKSFDPTV